MAVGAPRPRLAIEHRLSTGPMPKGQLSVGTANANGRHPSLVPVPVGVDIGIGTATLAPAEHFVRRAPRPP